MTFDFAFGRSAKFLDEQGAFRELDKLDLLDSMSMNQILWPIKETILLEKDFAPLKYTLAVPHCMLEQY